MVYADLPLAPPPGTVYAPGHLEASSFGVDVENDGLMPQQEENEILLSESLFGVEEGEEEGVNATSVIGQFCRPETLPRVCR